MTTRTKQSADQSTETVLNPDGLDQILPALLAFQRACPVVSEKSVNPHFKSRYADLPSIVSTCRPHLVEVGLVVLQPVVVAGLGESDGPPRVEVTTTVYHAPSGQCISSTLALPIGQRLDPQSIGSLTTYAKRYGFAATLGIVTDEDDDGEKAMASHRSSSSKPAPARRAPAKRSAPKAAPAPVRGSAPVAEAPPVDESVPEEKRPISPEQKQRVWAIARSAAEAELDGKKLDKDATDKMTSAVRAVLGAHGLERTEEVTAGIYDQLCTDVADGVAVAFVKAPGRE